MRELDGYEVGFEEEETGLRCFHFLSWQLCLVVAGQRGGDLLLAEVV